MSSLLPWDERPSLTASILNPALIAATITWCVARYSDAEPSGMPWELSYLVPPLVLHHDTRKVLPRSAASHLASWSTKNRGVLAGFPDRSRRFHPHVNEGVRFGLRTGLLTMSGSAHLSAAIPDGVRLTADNELREILRKSAMLGVVFGQAGSSANIFTILGVSP